MSENPSGAPEPNGGERTGRHAGPDTESWSAGQPPTVEQPRTATGARHRAAARSPLRSVLFGLTALAVVLAALLIGVVTVQTKQLDANVSRVTGVFPTQGRPAEAANDSQTYLVAGVEQVAGSSTPLLDTVLLMHVTSDGKAGQVVAVPVDTWVADADATPAEGFASSGAQGLVGAVEQLSDVRVDHYVQLDFAGFAKLVDDLDGVDLTAPQAYRNKGYDFPAGKQHLDGPAALAYIRDADANARKTTAAREQAVVAAVVGRITALGGFRDLGTLRGLLGTLTGAASVDDTVSDTDFVNLVWGLRGVGQPAFVSMPSSGSGKEAGQTVVYPDGDRAGALWSYLAADTLAAHLDEFR